MTPAMSLAMALGLLVLSLAGCGSLEPKPDPSRFFTLSSLRQVEDAVVKQSGNPERILLGLGPIKFPGYLDRQEIVIRSGQNRFDVSENDRWAEPLDENFTRVLAQNLSALLGTARIVHFPWSSERKPKYQLEVEVFRFEVNSARDAEFSARWTVIDGSNKKPLNLKESRLTRAAKEKSTDASVAALSEALGDLSREIADTVSAIDGQGKP